MARILKDYFSGRISKVYYTIYRRAFGIKNIEPKALKDQLLKLEDEIRDNEELFPEDKSFLLVLVALYKENFSNMLNLASEFEQKLRILNKSTYVDMRKRFKGRNLLDQLKNLLLYGPISSGNITSPRDAARFAGGNYHDYDETRKQIIQEYEATYQQFKAGLAAQASVRIGN